MFASALRELLYSSLRMGLYDPCKAFWSKHNNNHEDTSFFTKFLAGATSGAIGAYIANPCDLIKIRQQGVLPNGSTHSVKTFAQHVGEIVRTEGGVVGLYKGVSATVSRGIVITASQLSSYDQAKQWLLHSVHLGDNYKTHFMYVMAVVVVIY